MAKQNIQFGPFTGVVSSLDPEMIPEHSAADMRNVMVEDGRITPRYGYRNLHAAQASFVSAWGLDYVQGYNSSNDLTQEYTSFEDISGTILPFAANVATGVRTQLKNGTSTVSLTQPAYGDQPGIRSFAFNGWAYTISPSDTNPLFRHTIGTTNDFLNMAAPAAPSAAPAVFYFYGPQDADTGPGIMYWDKANGTPLAASAVTLPASLIAAGSGSGVTDGYGTLKIAGDDEGTPNVPIQETITIDIAAATGPGAQNWTYIDDFVMYIQSTTVGFDPNLFQVSIENGAGASFQANVKCAGTTGQYAAGSSGAGKIDANAFLICTFPNKNDRNAYSDITSITVTWTRNGNANTSSGGNPNLINVFYLPLGNVDTRATDSSGNPVQLLVGYTYYDSTSGLESQISPLLTLDLTDQLGWQFTDPFTGTDYPYFARPKFFLTKSGDSNVTGYRMYGRRATDTDWFLISDTGLSSATTPNGYILNGATAGTGSNKTFGSTTYDASYDFRETWLELEASSIYALGANPFLNLISACPYKGWVVWGTQGGYANLQHSTIGNELAVYNNADLTQINPQNTAAPANFTLADNGSDDPIAMFPCGQSIIILGSHGVYAQSGYSPTTMSPPAKLPTSLGCAGQYAATLFHDDIGNPAVVYMSKNGEGIYMAQEDLYYLNETHYKQTELTFAVRGSIQSFLLAGGATLAQVRMGVDQTKDALWVMAGNRAMVLRRQSLADQSRHWEFYEYALAGGATIAYASFDTRNRQRWLRSTGEIDENEWNSSASAYITGPLSDGGSALSPLYYTTRKVALPATFRVRHVMIDREPVTDEYYITCASTRETTGPLTVASSTRFAKFPLFQQGREHQITLYPVDGQTGSTSRIIVELEGPLGDRYRS